MIKTLTSLLLVAACMAKKSHKKLMYGCDAIRNKFEVVPEDYNTRWVCAFYKNCAGSPMEYFHSNRILAQIYTDEVLNYRLCSVSRVNNI